MERELQKELHEEYIRVEPPHQTPACEQQWECATMFKRNAVQKLVEGTIVFPFEAFLLETSLFQADGDGETSVTWTILGCSQLREPSGAQIQAEIMGDSKFSSIPAESARHVLSTRCPPKTFWLARWLRTFWHRLVLAEPQVRALFPPRLER
eukprot:558593-Rhodomonas_salina.4